MSGDRISTWWRSKSMSTTKPVIVSSKVRPMTFDRGSAGAAVPGSRSAGRACFDHADGTSRTAREILGVGAPARPLLLNELLDLVLHR